MAGSMRQRIDAVALDMSQSLSRNWQTFIDPYIASGTPIYHVASLYEAVGHRISLSYVRPELFGDKAAQSVGYRAIKRLLDIMVVVLSMPLLLVLCGIVALAVKVSSPGSVLFVQERVGRHGVPFKMIKFRTMRVDAESSGPRFAGNNDHRVTTVGHFLRRYRLDELPQFWNIIKGEMSLVGPRPEQVPFAKRFEQEIPFYSYRHRVKPGLTGWAQVQQGYAADGEETREKLEYDLYYIKNASLITDLRIVAKTIKTVMTGFGAR